MNMIIFYDGFELNRFVIKRVKLVRRGATATSVVDFGLDRVVLLVRLMEENPKPGLKVRAGLDLISLTLGRSSFEWSVLSIFASASIPSFAPRFWSITE
jgi:hypothetical protein